MSNNKQAAIYVLIWGVMFFYLGYMARILQVEHREIKESKMKTCITMYKHNPVRTLADSYCDEFFNVLRLDNKD